MYKGQLEGFPPEVVEKMLYYQEEQTGKRNISIFEEQIDSSKSGGGFTWDDAWIKHPKFKPHDFWHKVIMSGDFDLFFEVFPKEQKIDNYKPPTILNTLKEAFINKEIKYLRISCVLNKKVQVNNYLYFENIIKQVPLVGENLIEAEGCSHVLVNEKVVDIKQDIDEEGREYYMLITGTGVELLIE